VLAWLTRVAEAALQFQGFGGAGADGRAEKLELGKQKSQGGGHGGLRGFLPGLIDPNNPSIHQSIKLMA